MGLRLLIVSLLLCLPLNLPGDNLQTRVVFSDVSITRDEDGSVLMTIYSPEHLSGIQFDLEVDPHKLLLGKPEFSPGNRNFSLYTSGDSATMKVVALSLEGEELDLSEPVLRIPLSAADEFEGTVDLIVKDFVASTPTGTKVSLRVSGGRIHIMPSVPRAFRLVQNFPNPFNALTVIKFDLPEDAVVYLAAYNVLGEEIRVLKTGVLPAGFHTVTWDGKDDSGQPVSSGEYVCSLKVGANYHTMKMVLLR
ncbi:MAG: FlgD immunoglobulin-like domain containing protein [Fidelibacterota bacterium]